MQLILTYLARMLCTIRPSRWLSPHRPEMCLLEPYILTDLSVLPGCQLHQGRTSK